MSENMTALTIGGETKVIGLGVAGKLFVFSPVQMNFLLALQKLKNVAAASMAVGRDEEWGGKFLKTQKFRKYLSCKMEEYSVKNGLTVEWWYQFGRWSTDGYREFYNVICRSCGYSGSMNTYEVETFRDDEMRLNVECPACYQPIEATRMKEPFNPSREQVVAWQDLGARLIPKVERVHHQFEDVQIKFESEEASHG